MAKNHRSFLYCQRGDGCNYTADPWEGEEPPEHCPGCGIGPGEPYRDARVGGEVVPPWYRIARRWNCEVCGLTYDTIMSGDVYCQCGAIYNTGGQRLSDPRTWGEETGEHWTDVQRAFGPGGDGDGC